jgi:enoyl-CoA hydratase
MNNELIEFAGDSAICQLTLKRPLARNALSLALLKKVALVIEELKNNKKARALIITGDGNKAFCAGADLKERQGMSNEESLAYVKLIQKTCDNLSLLPIPVIAALNGDAFGGGLELALSCDIRLSAKGAAFGLTECGLGIIPGAGGTQRLPLIVGMAKASEMIFMAKRINAEEALAIGLINALASEDQDVLSMAKTWAETIEKNAPLAIRAAKKALWAPYRATLENGLKSEYALYETIINTKDRQEGLRAFVEKRSPNYIGQ